MSYQQSLYKINEINIISRIDMNQSSLSANLRHKRITLKRGLKIITYKDLFDYSEYRDLKNDLYLYNLDADQPKSCMFCLKSEPEVSFSSRAHVIPEFLGNKHLLHFEECNRCNNYFSSTLEDALDKYTKIFRTFDKIPNKKNKLVEYRSNNQKSRVHFDKENLIFQFIDGNQDLLNFDDEALMAEGKFDVLPCRPVDIFKGLSKIMLGVLPKDHLKNFSYLKEWLISDDHKNFKNKLFIMITYLPYFNKKQLEVFIKFRKTPHSSEYNLNLENSSDFSYIGLLSVGNIYIEFPLLCDDDIKKQDDLKIKMNLPLQPNPQNFIQKIVYLDNTEKVSLTHNMNFSYGSRHRLTELEGTLISDLPENLKKILANLKIQN